MKPSYVELKKARRCVQCRAGLLDGDTHVRCIECREAMSEQASTVRSRARRRRNNKRWYHKNLAATKDLRAAYYLKQLIAQRCRNCKKSATDDSAFCTDHLNKKRAYDAAWQRKRRADKKAATT